MQHAREGGEGTLCIKMFAKSIISLGELFCKQGRPRVQTLKPFRMAVRAKKLPIPKIDNQMLNFGLETVNT